MQVNPRLVPVLALFATGLSGAAFAQSVAVPDHRAEAAAVFAEAEAICTRDGGALWGRSLCGPILMVDWHDRSVVANTANPALTASGSVYTGTLPETVNIANTPTEWSGTRWTQMVWTMPDDAAKRHVLIAHELFHRIQPSLGLTRPESENQHLDTLEGRYLLQMEWRALAAALNATAPEARKAAVADALLFRGERYRLFPAARDEERGLEINEGVPEYTGVMLGLETPQERTAFAIHDLSAFVGAPTFVRSFAYATGPALGLLLDGADPDWKDKLQTGQGLDGLLAAALALPAPDFATLQARKAAYDDGSLRAAEEKRDADRQAHLAALRARLIDGPVLVLPLTHANYQFNPQTLQPLGEAGTVFPTLRLTDDWGVLEVESGGALLNADKTRGAVSVTGVDASHMKGDGWTLSLAPGWTVGAGARDGDLILKRP